MIKRIIFDIDNTLFDTQRDCISAYDEFLSIYKYNISAQKLYDLLDELNYIEVTTVPQFYEFLKSIFDETFTLDVFDDFCAIYIKHASLVFKDYSSLLEDLSKEYELYAWTNWFDYIHINKLNNLGLLKYFKKVCTIDNFGRKPCEESYSKICSPYLYSECAMVGDSMNDDILPSTKLGMKSVYIGSSEEYLSVTSAEDLRDIFLGGNNEII